MHIFMPLSLENFKISRLIKAYNVLEHLLCMKVGDNICQLKYDFCSHFQVNMITTN